MGRTQKSSTAIARNQLRSVGMVTHWLCVLRLAIFVIGYLLFYGSYKAIL